MRYYLIAGEASGDLHGSNLMKGLKNSDPDAEFRFWGGDLMANVGGTLVKHYKETNIMGFTAVLTHLGKISKNFTLCHNDILEYKPDVVILIDYPGFNFRIARFAHKHNIKVFYYIAPKVWAWKEHRVHRLQKYVDKLYIIFPFEKEYFAKWNIDAIYEGNPLKDSITEALDNSDSREIFCEKHGLNPKEDIVAFLPGSRRSEIKFLLPRYIEAAKLLPEETQKVMAAAPGIDLSYYNQYFEKAGVKPFNVIINETYPILKYAKVAAIASGTASLEAIIIGTPHVVCYGANPISIAIARRFVKIKYFSLGNILANRRIVDELLQKDCNPRNIYTELNSLMISKENRDKVLNDYTEIRDSLGKPGSSERIAQSMINEIKIN